MNRRVATIKSAEPKPAGLSPLPAGAVIVLSVRRTDSATHERQRLALDVAEGDEIIGAYTEELIAAWTVIGRVAEDVLSGRRLLGGQKG